MLSSSDLSHEHLYLINPFDHQEVNQQQFFQQQYHQCYYQPPLTDFTHTYNNINTNFQTLSNQIFSAAYSGIQVFEMLCEGIAVMRRRADSYLNATQILKVAGIDKGKRTKILEKEISQGEHEKVQGGYGKYQGTWIPYERGVDLARQYYVIDLLKPILEFDPPIPGVKPTFNNRECLPKVKVYNTKEKDSKEISISKKRKQTVKDAKESNIELPKKQKKSYYEKKKKVDSQLQAPPLKSAHKVQKIRALAKSNEQQNVRQNLKQPVNQISTPSIILNENTYQYPNQGILIEQEELYRPERYKEDLMALFLNENAVFPDFLKNPNPPADLDVDLLIDEQGHTSLHWASALAKTVLLSLLISKKAQINARNFSGESALIRSVLVTNNYNLQTFPIVLELLHTSLYLEDNQNQNVLHHIALLDASEKVEAGKYYMECILEYIARNENGNFNKLVNAQNKSGDTPLIIAARMGHKNYVEQLLEAGADISLENRSGLGPKDFGLDYFFGYNELKYHDELIVECNHDDSNSLNFPLDGFMSNTGILPEQYLEEHNYFLQANAFCLNEVDLKQNYQLYNNSTFNSSPPVKFVFPISKTDEATHSSFKPISLISDNLNESNENEGTRRKLNGNPNKINDEFYNLHNPVLGQEFNDKSYIETELEFTKAHFEDTVIDSFFLDSVLNTFENDKDIGVADISSFLVEVRKQEEKSCIKECDLEKQRLSLKWGIQVAVGFYCTMFLLFLISTSFYYNEMYAYSNLQLNNLKKTKNLKFDPNYAKLPNEKDDLFEKQLQLNEKFAAEVQHLTAEKIKQAEIYLLEKQKNLTIELGKDLRLLKDLFNSKKNTKVEKYTLLQLENKLLNWLKTTNLSELNSSFTNYEYGIVMCIGEGKTGFKALAFSTIKMIREVFKSKIKIEIFYKNDADLKPNTRLKFSKLTGISFKNLDNYIKNDILKVEGFNLKPFAMLFSCFEKVMLIDSDTVFLQNPELLFNSIKFRSTGSLFFHDRQMYPVGYRGMKMVVEYIKHLMPLKISNQVKFLNIMNERSYYEQESGVVLVDKSKHLLGIIASCLLLRDEERSISSKYIYGDKETYWLGFAIMEEEFSFLDYKTGTLGVFEKVTDLPCGGGKVNNGYCKDGCCSKFGWCGSGEDWCSLAKNCAGSCYVFNSTEKRPTPRYKMCSPKILHLDEVGEPLWINGGLIDVKYEPNSPLTKILHWASEPGYWRFMKNNIFCFEIQQEYNHFNKTYLDVIQRSGEIYLQAKRDFYLNNQ